MSLSTVAILALGPIFLYWWVFRTVFNPVSLLLSSFAVTIAFAYFVDYLAQMQPLHGNFRSDPSAVAPLYGIGLGVFLIPWLRFPFSLGHGRRRRAKMQPSVKDIAAFQMWTTLCSVVVLLALVACFVELRSIPIVAMLLGRYTIAEHIENIKLLPVGLMAVLLVFTFMLILNVASMAVHRRAYGVGSLTFLWLTLILAMSAIWQGNRQIFLLVIFFLVARWSIASSDMPRQPFAAVLSRAAAGIFILFLFVSFFVAVGNVRHTADGGGPPLELLTYFSWPVYNIIAIKDSGHFGGQTFPHYVLTELLPSRFGGKDQVVEMGKYLFEPTSPSGYFCYWFLDFGYAGVAIGAFTLSLFSRWAFRRSRRSEIDMRIYMLALWCCATAGIYNHFLSLHYFLLPLCLLLAQKLFLPTERYASGTFRPAAEA